MSSKIRSIGVLLLKNFSASLPELATVTECFDAISLRLRYSVFAVLSSTTRILEGYFVSSASGVSCKETENFSTISMSPWLKISSEIKSSMETISPLVNLAMLFSRSEVAFSILATSSQKSIKKPVRLFSFMLDIVSLIFLRRGLATPLRDIDWELSWEKNSSRLKLWGENTWSISWTILPPESLISFKSDSKWESWRYACSSSSSFSNSEKPQMMFKYVLRLCRILPIKRLLSRFFKKWLSKLKIIQ